MGFEQTVPNKIPRIISRNEWIFPRQTNQRMFLRASEIERSNKIIENVIKHFQKSVRWRRRQRKTLRYCIR